MAFECSAVILVILVMSFMMLRAGQAGNAIGCLPLVIVPSFHIVSAGLASMLAKLTGLDPLILHITVDIFGLMIACILLGVISLQIKKKRVRVWYLVTSGGFCAVLTCVLVGYIIGQG